MTPIRPIGATITNSNIQIVAGGVVPNAVVINNNAVNYTFSNAGGDLNGIGGTTGITKSGTGTASLNGPNTFTGPVAVNAGVLALANSGAFGASQGITVTSGASVQFSNNITLPASIPFTIQGTGTANSPGGSEQPQRQQYDRWSSHYGE